MTIRLDLIESAPIDSALRDKFKSAFDTAMIDLAIHLQQSSPRGVSSGRNSLAGGWDVIPAKKRRGLIPEVIGQVVNTSTDAEFRVRGRGPGRFPPYEKGSNLEKWAQAAGIPAYLVARKIAREGTDRWKKRDNILKQDPVTLKFAQDSPLYTVFERRLEEEWNKIIF